MVQHTHQQCTASEGLCERSDYLVEASDLTRIYEVGEITFQALAGVSLQIERGDFIAVMGHSGSGKSTLLHLLGGLDQPTGGAIDIAGHALHAMDESALARFRREHIGVIFQFFNLIDNLTAQANVELPALLAPRADRPAIRKRASQLLARLGLEKQASKYPWELSGGEQQRVAIARALINGPTLLLADEPTGNLDSLSSQDVLNILAEFNNQGQTTVMVTHDAVAAARAQQILFLHDGRIVDAMPGGESGRVAQRVTQLG